jgi:hypothetical protein
MNSNNLCFLIKTELVELKEKWMSNSLIDFTDINPCCVINTNYQRFEIMY